MKRNKKVKVYRKDYLNTFAMTAVIAQLHALGYVVRVV